MGQRKNYGGTILMIIAWSFLDPKFFAHSFKLCPPSILTESLCSCVGNADPELSGIYCQSPAVTQQHIDTALKQVRLANDLGSEDWLEMGAFNVQQTRLKQLDLSFLLLGLRVGSLKILHNSNLSKIVFLPPTKFPNQTHHHHHRRRQIDAISVTVAHSLLSDEGFGNFFKYFTPNMKILELYWNRLEGSLAVKKKNVAKIPKKGSKYAEFLPGLSSLTELVTLGLNGNRIERLGEGQFYQNSKLAQLYLYNNGVKTIGENAFRFSVQKYVKNFDDDDDDEPLSIVLYGNKLTDKDIHPNNGLLVSRRPIRFYIQDNKLRSLPRRFFQKFLQKNDKNFLAIVGNPISCDKRVDWIRQADRGLRSRVWMDQCVDDDDESEVRRRKSFLK